MFKNLLILILLKSTLSYMNQTQHNNTSFQDQVIMQQPKVVTETVMQKPKIITERVTNPARVVTDQIIEPTRQRIVIQPTINKTIETLKPQYNVQPDNTLNKDPVTQTPKYQYESRTQVENVPGDVINNNYIVEPTVKTIRKNVQFQPSQEIRQTLPTINRVPQITNNSKTLNYTVPADQHITQPYVQPIQQRETVNIDWQQEQDNVTNLDPITRQPIYQNRSRVQNVSVPGNMYYRQNVIQPTVNREEVEVRFNQPAPNHSTNQPVIRPTQHSHQQQVIRNVVPYTVKDEIPVGVPTPVVHDVPVYHYQYVPVEEPSDGCCNDDPLGGIESIVNSSEVVITNGNGDVIGGNSDRDGQRGHGQRGDGRGRGRKEIEFEDAVKHFKGLYGDDTFDGDIRFFDFERDTRDPNISLLKKKVLREKRKVEDEDDEKRRLAYLRHVYGSNCKRYKKVFGENPYDPIFERDVSYGRIPALNGYKNYRYYEDCD